MSANRCGEVRREMMLRGCRVNSSSIIDGFCVNVSTVGLMLKKRKCDLFQSKIYLSQLKIER